MEIAKYRTLPTNVLYLQYKHSNSVFIWELLKVIESNDYIIIGNLLKTRSIRTKQHYQAISGISKRTITKSQN